MAVKKSELYGALWKSCDELRGGMDASQYKDYVLVLLFMKYVTDRYAKNPDVVIVPTGGSFADLVTLANTRDAEIGDKTNKVIHAFAAANPDLKGAIDLADFNDPDKLGRGKDMVDRLTKLIKIFNRPELDFSDNSAEGDDLLGDAYEYLMRHFATESGKSKGQFYTPAEVSRIMAKVVGAGHAVNAKQTIYDPTCGSGSLLLKAYAEARHGSGYELAVYGQEMDNATAALAKMNMVLHDCATAEIYRDNTITHPGFMESETQLKTFDFIVANPPFSTKSWTSGLDADKEYGRFTYGRPPEKNGDYAFLLHMLTSLNSTGKAAVVLPHGVLFRGGAEGQIRRQLVQHGFVKAIIGLPANLFYGTGIPACVIVLDKENAGSRSSILMIDASAGYRKDGAKNRLRDRDMHRIVDTFNNGVDVAGYARAVPIAEIADPSNDYNLNLPRYIDSLDREDIQDLDGHLHGGIPQADIDALAGYWDVLPGLRDRLFTPAGRPGYFDLAVPSSDLRATVETSPDYQAWLGSVRDGYQLWLEEYKTRLRAVDGATRTKDLIFGLADCLLSRFAQYPLVDPYAVYQQLMSYWNDTLQDDVYLVATSGWVPAAQPHEVTDSKDGVDFTVGRAKYRSELLPAAAVVPQRFTALNDEVDAADASVADLEGQLAALVEENSGDDGFLSSDEVTVDEKINMKRLTARLNQIKADDDYADELAVLDQYTKITADLAVAKKAAKAARETLNTGLHQFYISLDETVVVESAVAKWVTALTGLVNTELDHVSAGLVDRLMVLSERYATPLSQIETETEQLAQRVTAHLIEMGLS